MKFSALTNTDLRSKKPAELEAYINEVNSSLAELRHALATNKEKQTHQVKVIKKSIARAKTVLAEQVTQEKEK
jgi:ribosomal protein L29